MANRKRANAQPVDDMTGGPLPPKKTLRTATLGRRDWDTGNAFTINYDVTHDLPCVVLVSTHPTVKPGQKVKLTDNTQNNQVFADRIVIPLRVFLDLVHMVLTHNEDKYQDLYSDVFPSKEDPGEVVKGMPAALCADAGCYHTLLVFEDGDTAAPKLQDATGNNNTSPKIPEVSKEHLRFTGTPGIDCTIVRQPEGPIFISTSGWGIETDDGEKTTVMATEYVELEYVFPLCHTEQLPGLVAVVHKWLETDYQKLGLLVTCNVPSHMTLIPTPIEALGYQYTLASMDQYWPLLSNPKDMWHTSYEDTVVSVEPQYGICRNAMIECPHSKRHCPNKKRPRP